MITGSIHLNKLAQPFLHNVLSLFSLLVHTHTPYHLLVHESLHSRSIAWLRFCFTTISQFTTTRGARSAFLRPSLRTVCCHLSLISCQLCRLYMKTSFSYPKTTPWRLAQRITTDLTSSPATPLPILTVVSAPSASSQFPAPWSL